MITGGPKLCAERTFGGHGTCGIFLKHNGRSLNKPWQRDCACETVQDSTKTTKVPWHGPGSNNSIGNMTVYQMATLWPPHYFKLLGTPASLEFYQSMCTDTGETRIISGIEDSVCIATVKCT